MTVVLSPVLVAALLIRVDSSLKGVEEFFETSSADMGEKAAFDGIVFRAVAWIVCHANRLADRIRQLLQIGFDNVLRRRVASTTVEEQQDRRGMRIALLANAIPVPEEAVAGKFAGVMQESQVNVATIAERIRDAVWDQHPIGPRRKVMIEGFLGV